MSGLDEEQLDELEERVAELLEKPWDKNTGRPRELTFREALVIRKPECRELLQWEHEWNNQVSSFRVPVERAIGNLKTRRILFTDYRRPLKTFKSSFRAAMGLYFFKEAFA